MVKVCTVRSTTENIQIPYTIFNGRLDCNNEAVSTGHIHHAYKITYDKEALDITVQVYSSNNHRSITMHIFA